MINKEIESILCWNCGHIVPFSVESRRRVRTVNDRNYEYVEQYGVCSECHNILSVPGLDDINEKRYELIFQKANEAIDMYGNAI